MPSAFVVLGYGISFWLLALVLRDLSVGTTYAVWSAAGTALIAVVGVSAFGEPATALKLATPRAHHHRGRGAQPGRQSLVARDTRAKLLDAASAVIRRDGPQALTLDAVAAEAGVLRAGCSTTSPPR